MRRREVANLHDLVDGDMLVKRAVIGSHIATGADTETNAAAPRIDDENGAGDEVSVEFESNPVARFWQDPG